MIGNKKGHQYVSSNNNVNCKKQFTNQPAVLLPSPSSQSSQPATVSFFQRIIGGTSNTESPESEIFVPKRSTTIDEFKSVQSLKQFWISAFGGSSTSVKKCDTNQKNATLSSIQKQSGSGSSDQIVVDRGKEIKSLTLNRNFVTDDKRATTSSLSLTDDKKKRLTQKNTDNFYKYKTADLVKNKRNSCEVFLAPTLIVAASSESSTGDKIHWAKRNDIILTKTNMKLATRATDENMLICTITTDNPIDKKTKDIMAHNKTITDKIASAATATSKTNSKNSSTNSLAVSCTDSPRKSANSTTRKCSFRTNAYHTKKMSANGGGSKVAALTHRFNQLIQQDADIIKGVHRNKEIILHRRGCHVFKIMAEDTSDTINRLKKSASKRCDSIGSGESTTPQKSIKKKPSVKRKVGNGIASSGGFKTSQTPVSVKETIQIFEKPQDSKTNGASLEKPKVPDKSAQVLQRTKEIAVRNSLKKLKQSSPSPIEPIEVPIDKRLENIKEEDDKKVINIETKNVDNVVQDAIVTDEENPKKNKYTRLYEKFRFNKPAFLSSKKSSSNRSSPDRDATKKIDDALVSVNQRIEHLSKSESCLMSTDDDKHYQELTMHMKPNQSFLFRTTSKTTIIEPDIRVVEAINTCVITKTRSMDETRFPHSLLLAKQISLEENREFGSIFRETDELLHRIKESIQTEDDYEPIKVAKVPESLAAEEEHVVKYAECKQLSDPATETSSLYQSIIEAIENPMPEKNETEISSSIYQSIAEVKSKSIKDKDCESINSYESYENYEAVDDEQLENIKNENGYEICAQPKDGPPKPPPPRALPCTPTSPEPPLPVPKRNFNHFELQKSESTSSNYEIIKYDKIPPRPPKIAVRTSSPDEEYDDENIYDIIKPVPQQIAAGPADYESIQSHQSLYLRTKLPFKQSTDSDSGSTLSSDNKTNSLYGTPMNRESITTAPSEGGSSTYSGDNSDEWIDISDGENDDRQKRKFVV